MKDEILYKLFKALEHSSETNQRALAAELDMSVGNMNHCIKKLIDSGFLTTETSVGEHKKRCFIYHLTPEGIAERAAVTMRYLKARVKEYQLLEEEISQLKKETSMICAALQSGFTSMNAQKLNSVKA